MITCSLTTTFPRKSSVPFSFLASLMILRQGETLASSRDCCVVRPTIQQGASPPQTIEVAFDLLKFLTEGHFFIFVPVKDTKL